MFDRHFAVVDPDAQHRAAAGFGEILVVGVFAIGQGLPAGFEFGVQVAPVQRFRNIDRFGQVADVGLGARPVEQRLVEAERVEGVEAGPRRRRAGGGALHRVGLQAPEEQADVRQVVAAGRQGADVGGVGFLAEWAVDAVERPGLPEVRRAQGMRAQMIQILGSRYALEELDGTGAPAGGVEGQFFEDQRRALAPAQAQGVGDERPRAESGGATDGIEGAHAEQVADVGDDPVFAGFDEGVVVEPFDVGFDERTLAGDDAEQGAQRVARFGVALAVEGGQQGKQGFGVELHDVRSVRVTAAGSISSRSAGCRLLPCQRALRAGMLPSGPFEVKTVRPDST